MQKPPSKYAQSIWIEGEKDTRKSLKFSSLKSIHWWFWNQDWGFMAQCLLYVESSLFLKSSPLKLPFGSFSLSWTVHEFFISFHMLIGNTTHESQWSIAISSNTVCKSIIELLKTYYKLNFPLLFFLSCYFSHYYIHFFPLKPLSFSLRKPFTQSHCAWLLCMEISRSPSALHALTRKKAGLTPFSIPFLSHELNVGLLPPIPLFNKMGFCAF